jgi:chromosome segregation ATPase
MERDAGSRSTATTHLTPLAIELAKFVSTVNMIATERDEFKRTNKHILGQLEASERSHHQELKAARKSWSDLRDQSLRVQEDRAREAQALADQDRALIGELQTLLSQSQAETSDLRKAVAEADEAQQTMKEQLSSSASRLRAEEVTKATLEGLRLDRASALRARDQAIADLQANRQFYQDKVDAAKKTTEEQLISAQQTVKQLSAERSMSETAAEDANQVCNKIREDLRTRTQDLDAIQQVVSGQEEDLHALEQQRDELEKAVEEAQERANEVKESMLRDLKALQDKNSTLADQLSTAITSRDQITKSTEDAQKACDDAKREKETTAVHLAAAQAKVTILESGLETLRGTGDKANLALKEANTAATASWEAENAAIDQLEGAREEIIALKASLDKAKLNQDAQDIARQAFEREIDVLKDNLEEAKLEQQTATLSCAKLERSVKVANRACRAADLAKDCAVAEQQELAGKCTTLQDKKAGIQQEADRLAKVAEDAAGKMDKYKKMVEIHKSSGQPNEPMTNAGDFLDKQNKIERLEKRLEKVKKRVMVLEQEKGGGAWRQGTSSTTQDKKPRINGL